MYNFPSGVTVAVWTLMAWPAHAPSIDLEISTVTDDVRRSSEIPESFGSLLRLPERHVFFLGVLEAAQVPVDLRQQEPDARIVGNELAGRIEYRQSPQLGRPLSMACSHSVLRSKKSNGAYTG